MEGRCDDGIETSYAIAGTELADGETQGIIDIYGRIEPPATFARVTFTSGRVVTAIVQSDGYFLQSLFDSTSAYGDVASVEPAEGPLDDSVSQP